MTDQSDILLGAQAAPQQAPQATVSNPTEAPVAPTQTYAEYLKTIKNEEGLQKYASVEDALIGTAHAQEFIKTLKDEKQMLEQQLNEFKSEFTKRMEQQEQANQLAFAKQDQQPTVQGLGKEDVYSAMEEYEQSKVRKSNRKSVVDTLVNHCNGDEAKAAEYIGNKLKELGMTRDQLASLAESSPNAVYNLFQVNGKGTKPSSIGNSINPDAVEAHVKMEAPRAKRLPIGADNSHLVNEWRASVAETNANLGIN